MKLFALVTSILLSTSAFAHPNGTYKINEDANVTVTFNVISRCPVVTGALTGSLRSLTFSELALEEPYLFIDGNYVEIHEGQQEVYVNTDENCVPVTDGPRIEASRNTFGGYALQRM
jgi:hypothetical protein